MFQNTSQRLLRGYASGTAVAALCLTASSARVHAQAGMVPAGAPETAPTTVQGRPAPSPPAPRRSASPTVVAAPQAPGFLGLSYTPQSDGMLVSSIIPGGPAALGGVQEGDIVTALNGQPIDADHALASLVAAQVPGTTVRLSLRRGGTSRTLDVQLGRTPRPTLGTTQFSDYSNYGPPPFSGTYKGHFRAVYLPGTGVLKPQTGTLSLTVTPGGAVTGSIHTDSGGLDGTVAGSVSSVGEISLAFTFTSGASGTLDGLLGLTPGGHLAGTLSQSFGPSPSGTLTWDGDK